MNSEPLTQKEKERIREEFTWLPYKSWTDKTEDEREKKDE